MDPLSSSLEVIASPEGHASMTSFVMTTNLALGETSGDGLEETSTVSGIQPFVP